jgi:hypothetical protein
METMTYDEIYAYLYEHVKTRRRKTGLIYDVSSHPPGCVISGARQKDGSVRRHGFVITPLEWRLDGSVAFLKDRLESAEQEVS